MSVVKESKRVRDPMYTYGNIRSYYKYLDDDGKLHREDGPAARAGSWFSFYQNGKKHRFDGPAKYWKGSWVKKPQYEIYYVAGKKYSKKKFEHLSSSFFNSLEGWY